MGYSGTCPVFSSPEGPLDYVGGPLRRLEDALGFRLHPLKGDRAGQWSVRVPGNWRAVFRFEDGEAVDVDLIGCH